MPSIKQLIRAAGAAAAMLRKIAFAGLLTVLPFWPVLAGELEIGLYGGMNESARSYGELDNGVVTQGGYIDWEGLSFQRPIYYGARLTYWPDTIPDWGFGIDFTHAKAHADLGELDVGDSYERLELTHGLNLLTANVFYKHDFDNGLRAYAGLGAGLSTPHMEIATRASTIVGETQTDEYQITGPAAQAIIGASYEFAENWRVFGEYKLSYSVHEANLSGSSGTFSTNLTSHHILAGLSYAFDAGDF
jgi:lipid A oxidase